MFDNLRKKAKDLKQEVHALYLASRDPRTPFLCKFLVAIIIAYALSPIDLIPDFIPVLGYLDDLILIPLGIGLAIKMIPNTIMVECREKAKLTTENRNPTNWIAGIIIVFIWVTLTALFIHWIYTLFPWRSRAER